MAAPAIGFEVSVNDAVIPSGIPAGDEFNCAERTFVKRNAGVRSGVIKKINFEPMHWCLKLTNSRCSERGI